MSAVLCRAGAPGALAVLVALLAPAASAQSATSPAAERRGRSLADAVTFVAGGAAAFGMHEGAHLVFDAAFDADPSLKRVHFGPVPFFAIAHRGLTPAREIAVSSAGLWTQHATSEWLLTRRPGLRAADAPFARGLLAFDVLASGGYGLVALARAGPFERDTRGIADAARVDERIVGTLALAPAILDAYRYWHPDSRWAVWTSRLVKAGSVALIFR
ncbi:MAG: hypothetical protein IT176_03725 [Acidobacteria bacterium]|nr:hypothetical protein [Acidobacteriota bacterium]